MGNPVFRQPLNPDWRAKVSYKGKTDLVREKRKENPRLVEKEAGLDYRFHTAFQQDFYESVIIPKNKSVALSSGLTGTLYVEERGDTRKFHWMTEGRWYEITYEQFARLFGFEREDANHNKIHFALRLDASKLRFMYPSNKRGSV
jgi:hypothetical protein